jgi:hypothetical protein
MLGIAMLGLSQTAYTQETVKAVEECVDNNTQCLKCGGFCTAGCCNPPPVLQ